MRISWRTVFSLILVVGLFGCTLPNPTMKKQPTTKENAYLKQHISQAELADSTRYKRYRYRCHDWYRQMEVSVSTYFPLWRESRMKAHFGIYFQLAGQPAIPFDHVENKPLNARGTRFEVIYRSYIPIEGQEVELIAREKHSTYYKRYHGQLQRWLTCREAS